MMVVGKLNLHISVEEYRVEMGTPAYDQKAGEMYIPLRVVLKIEKMLRTEIEKEAEAQ